MLIEIIMIVQINKHMKLLFYFSVGEHKKSFLGVCMPLDPRSQLNYVASL